MKLGMIVLAMLIGAMATGGTAAAAGSYMNASYIDTTVWLADDGSAHVEKLLMIEDVSQSPVVAGAITVELSGNGGAVGQVLGAQRNFSNISVARVDGRPLQYTVNRSGAGVVIEAICEDILMEHWNTKLAISYDLDPAASRGMVTDTFAMSGMLSGYGSGDASVTVILPPGRKVVYASEGAVVGSGTVRWSGDDSRAISLEYTRLPLPGGLSIPFQYLFWGTLILGALAGCVALARW